MMHTTSRSYRTAALAAASVVAATAFLGAAASAEQSTAVTVQAQAQRTQQGNAKSDRARTPMERCMASWDRSTQMSKQEWRETCKRTVKEYPDLFSKSY